MSGRLSYPGTPRHRKRMNTRKLVYLSLVILLCVFTGYLITPYRHPRREFQDPAAAAPIRNLNRLDETVEGSKSRYIPALVDDVNASRGASAELRQSEFCTNHCNSSEIYSRLWYAGRVRENARMFHKRDHVDGDDDDAAADVDDPYQESIETNVVAKDFRVVIKVLAFNRLESLSRCLLSLAKADYGGDTVNIQIFVDHFRYDEVRKIERVENTSAVPSDSTEEPSVEGRMKRLLWGFFKREHPLVSVPTAANPAAVPAFGVGNDDEVLAETEAGQEMVGGLPTQIEGQGDDPAMGDVDVQPPAGNGDLNDDFERRTLETKSVDEQLEESHEILRFVDNFWWSHGKKEVHYRSQNVGLQAQWIESWWPADLDEFAFIVEDDMEVSNLYYRFLRTVIATYYYNPEQYDPSVYGVSLQRPRFVPGKGGLPLNVNSTKNLFMYPLVGTWGQLLFPRQWKEFRLWYDKNKSKGERPVLEGMVTNSWYKKLGERIWTPWFVKFAHTRGYFNLYTNFFEERALSVSHREPGSNYMKAAGPDSELIDTKREGNDTMLWVMSPSKSLPQFDFCFRAVKIWTVARAVPELSLMLASVEENLSVLLVNLIGVHSTLVRNFLCHMERLGLRKFVLLGDDNDMTRDLARRGYATVSAELFTELETAGSRLRRDMIAAQAVHEVLILGFSVWLTRADTVWVHNPFETGVDTGADIMGSQPLDGFHPSLLYIQASQGSLWSKWVGNLSVVARDASVVRHSSAWLGFQDFISANKNCRYEALPRSLSGRFRDLAAPSTASGNKVILLNGLHGRNLPLVVNTLRAAGLWTIDKDLACTRVYC